MPRLPSVFLSSACVALVAAAASLSFASARYGDALLRVSDGRRLGLPQVVPDLLSVPLTFIGERHTDPDHHIIQVRVIRALLDRGANVAIGLEMFRSRDQKLLDRWTRGELTEDQFRPIQERNWADAWNVYRDIFLFARERGVPMLGLNVPQEITEQVAREGFYSLSSDQLAELPGVSCDLDEEYMELIRRALGAHGSQAGEERFTRFCEAQMVWDTTMAHRLLSYLKEHPNDHVVVLSGNSHAWKYAIPRQVRLRDSAVGWRVVLPEIELAQPRGGVTAREADYLWLLNR